MSATDFQNPDMVRHWLKWGHYDLARIEAVACQKRAATYYHDAEWARTVGSARIWAANAELAAIYSARARAWMDMEGA